MKMSRLSNFSNAPVEIEHGIKVYPLLAREQHLFDAIGKSSTDEGKLKAFRQVVKHSLRDEKVTDEELENMTLKTQNIIMEAIVSVNGYGDKVAEVQKEYERKSNIIRKDKTPGKES